MCHRCGTVNFEGEDHTASSWNGLLQEILAAAILVLLQVQAWVNVLIQIKYETQTKSVLLYGCEIEVGGGQIFLGKS